MFSRLDEGTGLAVYTSNWGSYNSNTAFVARCNLCFDRSIRFDKLGWIRTKHAEISKVVDFFNV